MSVVGLYPCRHDDKTAVQSGTDARLGFTGMPVIVVGADTEPGKLILDRLNHPEREIRAFVTSEATAIQLKDEGVKVALGDVSDESHIEGAALRCFSAVLVAEAAADNRERSFADSPQDVMRGWARAVARSKVKRVIWVTSDDPPETAITEVARVDPADPELVEKVAALDDAQTINRPAAD